MVHEKHNGWCQVKDRLPLKLKRRRIDKGMMEEIHTRVNLFIRSMFAALIKNSEDVSCRAVNRMKWS